MGRPSKVRYREDRDAWVTTFRGKYVTLARGKKNRAAAMQAFHRLQAGAVVPGADRWGITVGELCDRLSAWTRGHRSALTAEWYDRHLIPFVQHVGSETPANAIRPFHVAEWAEGQGWGQSTRHGAITAVKRVFRWGFRQGYLESDPLAPLEKPGIRRRETILSPDEERALLGETDGPLRDYLTVMRETGCRPSEVARMEAAHVAGDTVLMPGKTTRATGKPRVIYLTTVAAAIIGRLADEHPAGPIFRNTRGRPWTRNALALAMGRIRRRLGMGSECTAESLRHGWVTDAKLKLPNSVVAELAGHASTAMVDKHYGHVNLRRDELAAAARAVRTGDSGSDKPPEPASSEIPPSAPRSGDTTTDTDRSPPSIS